MGDSGQCRKERLANKGLYKVDVGRLETEHAAIIRDFRECAHHGA